MCFLINNLIQQKKYIFVFLGSNFGVEQFLKKKKNLLIFIFIAFLIKTIEKKKKGKVVLRSFEITTKN